MAGGMVEHRKRHRSLSGDRHSGPVSEPVCGVPGREFFRLMTIALDARCATAAECRIAIPFTGELSSIQACAVLLIVLLRFWDFHLRRPFLECLHEFHCIYRRDRSTAACSD